MMKTTFKWIVGILTALAMIPIIILLLPVALLLIWLDRTNYEDIFDDITEEDLLTKK